MSAHAMALALGRRAVYLSHFTPSMMAPETLTSAHSMGMASREAGSLAKRLVRISTAIRDSRGANYHLALLQLPKEERSLVEGIVNSRADAKKNSARTL